MYEGHLTQRTIYLQAGQIRLLLNSLVPSSSQNISLLKVKDVGIKTGTVHYLKPLILLKCKKFILREYVEICNTCCVTTTAAIFINFHWQV